MHSRAYLENSLLLWGLCLAGIFIWFVQDREAAAAGLAIVGSAGAFMLVTAFVMDGCFVLLQPVKDATAEQHRATLDQLENDSFVTAFVPASEADMPRWLGLSVTAGVTEEILYRGLLIGTLTPLLGLPGAAICSVMVFALGHAYQGLLGMVRVAGVGAVLTIVVWLAGAIWPAVLLHIVVDISSGRTVLRLKQLSSHENSAKSAGLMSP